MSKVFRRRKCLGLAVCCRTPITVSTLAQSTVIQHQLLQHAPATDFCTFIFIILHYAEQCTLSQQLDDRRNADSEKIICDLKQLLNCITALAIQVYTYE